MGFVMITLIDKKNTLQDVGENPLLAGQAQDGNRRRSQVATRTTVQRLKRDSLLQQVRRTKQPDIGY